MELTGKAKEEFLEWWQSKIKNENFQYFKPREDVYLNALIIEFLDSVGVYIYFDTGTYVLKPNYRYKIITEDDTYIGYKENSRKEATVQAIKKANEIYNERFK
ncbi:hypothetical protein AS589_09360 [Empedobacter brevis]|uniref:hypothetical protein n=1 Tax=Empedobacter brevis TaxID=247 RepID=UPI0013204C6A|nr:hypothetical protein [Empedobacter brevis]QHC84963.1 hypothetical protein AS589_09360 [Empedobacter brevis]